MSDEVKRIKVIDSHTAGEPTRVVVEGLPEFAEASASPADWRDFLRAQHDALRTCLLYTSPSPRDVEESRMPSSA